MPGLGRLPPRASLRTSHWDDITRIDHPNCQVDPHQARHFLPIICIQCACTVQLCSGLWRRVTNIMGDKTIDEVIRSDKISMDDLSSEWLTYLCTIDEPVAELRAIKLVRLRSILDRAVLLRAFDRIDAATISGRDVTVGHVVVDRGDNISGLESYYNGQCLRVMFNKDNNDFVDAYFSLDLASASLRYSNCG